MSDTRPEDLPVGAVDASGEPMPVAGVDPPGAPTTVHEHDDPEVDGDDPAPDVEDKGLVA